MKFATRLYVGFGIIIAMMTILLLININLQSRQTEEINELVKDRYQKIKILNKIREDAFYVHADLEGEYTSATDNNLKSINEILFEINNNIDTLIQMSTGKVEQDEMMKLKFQLEGFEETIYQYNQDSIELRSVEGALHKARLNRDAILSYITILIANQEEVMDNMIIETEQRLNASVNSGVISIAIGIILGIVLSFWSIRTITIRLGKLKEVMNSVENGSEQLPRITITKNDEIGAIATAYNQMAAALEEHEKNERLYKEDIEEQNRIQTQLADISILSQDLSDIKSLGQEYIQSIIPAVEASYGVIYIKKEKGNRPYLHKLATYATNNGKETIELGEDLAGQCLQDGRPKRLSGVPHHYVKIASGLGETKPQSILILPIELEGEILAVLEIASLQEFTKTHETLLKETTEQLGIIINRIQKQMQVKQLLDATKTLNEELQNQSEELQLQQEELKTMNEELESQYRKSEQRTNDLQKAKAALEEKTKQVLLSSQYKSEFLANMSHELRTPLNSLLILAQILVENKEGNLTNKQTQYANTIYSSGKDLLDLINDILDLSKIESGKLDSHIGEFDVRGVVSFVKNQFSAVAEQKGLTFNVQIEEDAPAILYSDEQKIYQILKNLVANALKFTEKGDVTLRVYVPEPEGRKSTPELLAFAVSDTGIGISPAKQELIFEAFQQADGTTSRKFGGTGLGLSISKGMADLIGGSITVESEEGEGSIFTFFLPINLDENLSIIEGNKEVAATVGEAPEPLLPAPDSIVIDEGLSNESEDILTGKSVLLVDDDMRNVFALTTALEEVGIDVHFAENGREALEVLGVKPDVDLVLMDIMMPEMDGYEAMKRIRSSTIYEQLPIIALTAKAMKDDREKCLEAGASDYISKPVNLNQLLSLLKVWLYK
ncbi:two-component system, chemotaxis family, sensor kinase CheA [Mesobacillus persicus]|uniref:Circadian input-output histidine kinase CikA n=1 Tax=Mesobacillus persicus TaxID=930146 RepID=A0A1H8BG87_9BACI|nr:response regulator [Mesobacillus persicus]SEM81499.1 two-component system, chemotaxis family, sensor kinase CheA [Mesobacillus persicus]